MAKMGNAFSGAATGAAAGATVGGPWGAVVGGGLGLAGGMMADNEASDLQERSIALREQMMARLAGIDLPEEILNRIYYEQYQNAGKLSPELEQIINAAPSKAGQVTGDKNLQAAQLEALNALKGISQTGMSSTDKARLNQIQQQMATKAEGQRQAILQNFAQRGQGGSGNELLAQLQASQSAANQANEQGLGVAANAQQNALQALGQYGQQAGRMEGQQFGQEFQAGTAQDALNRFNVTGQQGQQQRNIGAQNQAQADYLTNQQNIMNKNTGDVNQERLRQTNAHQQMFENEIAKATGQNVAGKGMADMYQQMGKDTSSNFQGAMQGAGQLAGQFKGAFGGGNDAKYNTMGTNSQSGGLTQESADAFSNYEFAHGGTVPPSPDDNENWYDHLARNGYLGTKAQVSAEQGNPTWKSSDYAQKDSSNGPPHEYANGGIVQTFEHGGTVEHNYTQGGMPMMTALMHSGGKVPGQAQVPGDSLKNDKVRALLSPGEIVIPRSITMHPDAPSLAKDFVNLELRKKQQR